MSALLPLDSIVCDKSSSSFKSAKTASACLTGSCTHRDRFHDSSSTPISAIACAIGTAAICVQTYKNECTEKVRTAWAKLALVLKQLGFRLWDFQSNFLLAQSPKGNAGQIYLALKEQRILVRYLKQPGLEDKLRITVGTDQHSSDAG